MKGTVPDKNFDAIWSSHNIEHLFAHQVDLALSEFARVLKKDGFALITCPDLASVVEFMRDNSIDTVAYTSGAGPITPLDMLFGFGRSIAAGNSFMAHRTGFTSERLGNLAVAAGFARVYVSRGNAFDLWACALMPDADPARIRTLLSSTNQQHLICEHEAS